MRTKARRPTKEQEAAGRFYDHVPPDPTHEETIFRHGHWQQTRNRIRGFLERAGASAFTRIRWDACGSDCVVEWSEQLQARRIRANFCHNRHCQPCAAAKANLIARNLRDKLGTPKRNEFRFITLTLKHSSRPLADQIQKLYASFRKLRKNPIWKNTQSGGAFMLEVKHTGRDWHPHLHIISQGTYLDKQQLSNAWLSATTDSMIIDIRALRDPKDAVHYVCKYITKSTSPTVWQHQDQAIEWIVASKGVRSCATFGRWRGFALCKSHKLADDWQFEAKLTDLVHRARNDEQHAWIILKSLKPPNQPPEID